MKPDYVKRDVRPTSARRAGDAPAIGRVAKIQTRGGMRDPRAPRRRSPAEMEQRKRQWHRKVLILRSSVIVATSLIVLVTVLLIWGKTQLTPPTANNLSHNPPLSETDKRVEVAFLSQQDAVDLTRQAIAATTAEEVRKYFHFPEGAEPQVLEFLLKRPVIDGKLEGFEWLDTIAANGMRYEAVLTRSFNLSDQTRIALIYPDKNEQWKIDYPAFARINEPDWEAIVSHQAAEGMARVMIAQDTYYNSLYADDSVWKCYGFASPDDDRLLLGYCRINSLQHRALEKIVPTPDQPSRVVLKIRHDPAAQDRQFEIIEVIAHDWVIGDIPFEQRFIQG